MDVGEQVLRASFCKQQTAPGNEEMPVPRACGVLAAFYGELLAVADRYSLPGEEG